MLRKLLIASAAVIAVGGTAYAADLPTTKGPPVYTPPPAIFTWTGFYAGAQVGYEWGRVYPRLSAPFVIDGFDGGGHVGYNYQFGQLVAGLEGDVDGSTIHGGNGTLTVKKPLDGSFRGRLGYAWDRALIYGTGGVAFGDFNYIFSQNRWAGQVGWTVGGGLDYALDNNWSLSAEYRYTDYGRYYFTVIRRPENNRVIDNRVQVGFSYKFDWAQPVVSKY
jgi:outer membrane immunogenic protein